MSRTSALTRRTLLAGALGGVAAGLFADPAAAARSTTPVRERAVGGSLGLGTHPLTLRRPAGRSVLSGAYVPDPYWDPQGWPGALDAYSARTGCPPKVLHWFVMWGQEQPFPTATARLVHSRGQIPLVTWEPWDWSAGTTQPIYRLSRITAGAFDPYVRRFAQQAKAFGSTVYLRFAPEMNGDWNPWSELVNGNRAGDYVRAWNHVRAIFASVGATNVRWVWTPIVQYPGSTPFARVFPGDAATEVVGLDGYNWGSTKPYLGWQSFSQVFGPSLTAVRALSRRPLWIAEVGCTESGGNKAAWIDNMFATVEQDTRIDALVWFNADKETDWRINSSPAALAAFQRGLGAATFR